MFLKQYYYSGLTFADAFKHSLDQGFQKGADFSKLGGGNLKIFAKNLYKIFLSCRWQAKKKGLRGICQ